MWEFLLRGRQTDDEETEDDKVVQHNMSPQSLLDSIVYWIVRLR